MTKKRFAAVSGEKIAPPRPLSPEVCGESERVGVTLVGGVVGALRLAPDTPIDVGEEDVGLGEDVMHACEAEAIGHGEELAVDLASADDEGLVHGAADLERLVHAVHHEAAGALKVGLSGEDNVAAVGQGALGQGVERATAHEDGVAHGEASEMLHIGRQMPRHGVAQSDGVVLVKSGNESDHIGVVKGSQK
jgi:hypothetical protein